MLKSIIYLSSLIKNKKPHQLANKQYYLVYVSDNTGSMFPALFTEYEVKEAILRASKNPEDAPIITLSWLEKILRKLTTFCR